MMWTHAKKGAANALVMRGQQAKERTGGLAQVAWAGDNMPLPF